MAIRSPLRRAHQEAEASVTPYGPTLVERESGEPVAVEVVETFGELELEYAAIRKGCVVIDQPNRGVVEVTGPDRIEFLNRMLTQELKDLAPFSMRRSFWLNRKGRVDADVRVIDLPHSTYLEMDVHAVRRTVETLGSYIVMEDVKVEDVTEKLHRFAVHGPTALELIHALSLSAFGAEASGPGVVDLPEGRAAVVRMADADCVVARDDSTGETGLEVIVPLAGAEGLYQQMLEVGTFQGAREDGGSGLREMLASKIRLRRAGWHAYNIARIEAGTPLYNLDFGPESLPPETGVMTGEQGRVSLKKGCYLGQEVVARMHARGQAKQRLMGIVFETAYSGQGAPGGCGGGVAGSTSAADTGGYGVPIPLQPSTGMAVFAGEAPAGDAIGVVTSSTVSPMLGSAPVAFAAIKGGAVAVKAGDAVCCVVEGKAVRGRVQEGLRFWKSEMRTQR